MNRVLNLCYTGATDDQRIPVQELYDCARSIVATCRTECTARSRRFDSPAGPILCMF